MLAVLDRDGPPAAGTPSLLDVGCGYGGLLTHARAKGLALDYTGVDVSENMIRHAQETLPEATFFVGDILELAGQGDYDYVVCNGILTQKLTASIRDMNAFAQRLVEKMFALCRQGIAFNVMSSNVNFMADNLYYRSPIELLGWCYTAVTPHVRLDHAYPLYEYTVYLYRDR
jgi:SAM-dependent methyltransferase